MNTTTVVDIPTLFRSWLPHAPSHFTTGMARKAMEYLACRALTVHERAMLSSVLDGAVSAGVLRRVYASGAKRSATFEVLNDSTVPEDEAPSLSPVHDVRPPARTEYRAHLLQAMVSVFWNDDRNRWIVSTLEILRELSRLADAPLNVVVTDAVWQTHFRYVLKELYDLGYVAKGTGKEAFEVTSMFFVTYDLLREDAGGPVDFMRWSARAAHIVKKLYEFKRPTAPSLVPE